MSNAPTPTDTRTPAAATAAAATGAGALKTPMPTTPSSSTTHEPRLPPSSTFDFVAPLHEILSRLLASSSLDPLNPAPVLATAPYPAAAPLEMKDLAAEVASIRYRIRKAREVCERLEEGGLSVEELEGEIRAEEERVGGLKRAVGEVGRVV